VSKTAYISVDIEASGPIPGEYSMLSVGACDIANMENTFYVELQPITQKFVPEAMKVNRLLLEKLTREGLSPFDAMRKFGDWIGGIAEGRVPIFIGFNLGFDWSFVNYYFIIYAGSNPFGVSGIDAESVWLGKTGCDWSDTSMTKIKRALHLDIAHTHNALDDAKEQAVIFERMLVEK
jgi:DNA polymerase III epsilon subunit-like protein